MFGNHQCELCMLEQTQNLQLTAERKMLLQLTSTQGLGTLARSSASVTPSANVDVPAIALQST